MKTLQLSSPLSVEECRRLFSYDASTGLVLRRERSGQLPAGSVAGCRAKDYWYVRVCGKKVLAHRLVWALYYGEWPDKPIDHINMDRHDNRIVNLRLASVTENNRNRPRQSNNTSGYKGVTFHKSSQKYQAKIMADKVCHSLGYYHSARDAADAYCRAAKALHGDFVRFDGGSNVR